MRPKSAINEPLQRSFYLREPTQVARDLLGKRLVRTIGGRTIAGRIVEVEAYLAQDDSANHAHRGRTRRNASMFGPPGLSYVYSIHARYCLNAVTEPEGVPSAVLIRAVEPLEGRSIMERYRSVKTARDLTRGPARLCEAFDIDRSLDAWDLTIGRKLWIARQRPSEPLRIVVANRVGVTSATDLPLRFFIEGNPFVSRPASGRRKQ